MIADALVHHHFWTLQSMRRKIPGGSRMRLRYGTAGDRSYEIMSHAIGPKLPFLHKYRRERAVPVKISNTGVFKGTRPMMSTRVFGSL